MKRSSYVDNNGNPINYSFESKKILLRFFFVIGTIVPIIIIGFIIYEVIQNNKCNDIYDSVKNAALEYLKINDGLPTIEGNDVTVSVDNLYSENYLSTLKTKNMKCSGSVKVTNYKDEYVYTLNLTNCNSCSMDKRYNEWSKEISYYPRNKSNVDIVPYYNYYQRQVNVTEWSNYFSHDELSDKESKYGFALPLNESNMPDIPEEANIIEVQKEDAYQYRYSDKRWRFYDIVGNYSEFSSEQPLGYANKDENTLQYTEWSEYSLEYPEEKDYRDIVSTTGYIFYYEKDGEKIYANNKNYTALEDIDQTKYNLRENQTAKMYRYRDEEWRWYNGQKRRYSTYRSLQPLGYNYRDDDTMVQSNYSSWSFESKVNNLNSSYRTEEKKVVTRFRYKYEILSAPLLNEPITKDEFLERIGGTIEEFVELEDYKIETSYKFKYQKR